MGAPLHCYTSAGVSEFLESWGVGESKWYCGVMVEATNSVRLHPMSLTQKYYKGRYDPSNPVTGPEGR